MNQERLMQCCLRPRFPRRRPGLPKERAGDFPRDLRCDQAGDQGGGRVAVQGRSRIRAGCHGQGKQKRFGCSMGRRKNWKKAFVCLKPGQKLILLKGAV